MSEQIFNIMFVGEVQKFPVLYNYTLKGYSKRDVTEKAWNEVGKVVNLSAAECKEKWKNLRSVFVRHLKPPPPGPAGNKKRPYYLAGAMQFTLPFIKTTIHVEDYLPTASQQIYDEFSQEPLIKEEEDTQAQMSPSSPPSLPSHTQPTIPVPGQHDPLSTSEAICSPTLNKKRKHRTLTGLDKSYKEYMDAETLQINHETKDSQRKEEFLESLLPEIEPLTGEQMRIFRRRVLQLIDEIRCSKDQDQVHLGTTQMPSPYISISRSSASMDSS